MIKNISNLGDASIYCDFGQDVNEEINLNVVNYFNHIKELVKNNKITGITNITPSYNKLIVSFDLTKINYKEVKEIIESLKIKNTTHKNSKKIKIPICCDQEYALDLTTLSNKLKISENEILEMHLNKEYFCYMTGFIAGMPFLGDIDKKIRVNRLETPRVRVPKGSVGITEQFCNIYTYESPGGWNIIGNTPKKIFNKLSFDNPLLINPGDKVSFYKITKKEYLNWNE